MNVITQLPQFKTVPGPVVLAAGFFDGVHRGHQLVLAGAVERARELAGQAWVLTFDRHPLAVLAPSKCPPLLCTLDERLALLERAGVDGALVLTFTRDMAVQSPESFVRWLCAEAVGGRLCEVRCGHNWRFGRRAEGTPELLARLGQSAYGFRVVVVPYADYQGLEVSSTRIRCAVREGRLDDAAAMLGRAYAVRGTVVRGRGIGRSLNAATANVQPSTEVLPPNGVYAVRVQAGRTVCNGVANLGVHPTFVDDIPDRAVLETHLLDFSGDLYGQAIEVAFLARLRDERVFESPEALTRQIADDVLQARRCF
ncbi:MAG: riboflavin biosynthesis protein RibF [Verrucomicrobiota bacterium]|jgi:riboflavin kinase/FMN adenylyltransferase|nr:riboflavin biosynthesis protein RibF [Verrucomicrobiota bacterium]